MWHLEPSCMLLVACTTGMTAYGALQPTAYDAAYGGRKCPEADLSPGPRIDRSKRVSGHSTRAASFLNGVAELFRQRFRRETRRLSCITPLRGGEALDRLGENKDLAAP